MKVLLVNGSSRSNGCTNEALKEVERALKEEGIETEQVFIGNHPLPDCIACRKCKQTGRCVFDDACLGTYGTAAFGGDDPPTYACVGTSDGIASWRTMQARLNAMESLGIPTEFHSYEGLRHGFGLGIGTVAEGWLDDAMTFWEKQMD